MCIFCPLSNFRVTPGQKQGIGVADFRPDQPKVAGLSAKSRFRHYTNLRRMTPKLRRLLRDFTWDRVDRVFASEIAK